MSLFAGLNKDGLEKDKDVVGGSGSNRLESNVYAGTLKAVYITKTKDNGLMANVLFTPEGSDTEYRESLFISNGKGQNYYEKNEKKFPYPGFTIIDDLCTIVTGKPLSEQDTEDKIFKLYDYDLKEEIPTTVPVISGLLGAEANLVIRKNEEYKQVKSDNGYVDTDEKIFTNEILKAIYPDGSTVSEKANKTDPVYTEAWLEKWKDTVYDKTKGRTPKVSGSSNSNSQNTERKSLFNKKA